MSETQEDNGTLFRYNKKWDELYLAPELIKSNYNFRLISEEKGFGIYTFALFSQKFCNKLVTKLKEFDGWTVNRHKTYPTNDILIEDFDKNFASIYNNILNNILFPSLNTLFDCNLKKEFTHETFIIRYNSNIQNYLDLHHDYSSFTCCVTFSDEADYEGGGTYFPKHKLLLKAKQGEVVIHPGQLTHQHGVRPIIDGERYSMVSFCRLVSSFS